MPSQVGAHSAPHAPRSAAVTGLGKLLRVSSRNGTQRNSHQRGQLPKTERTEASICSAQRGRARPSHLRNAEFDKRKAGRRQQPKEKPA